MRTMLRTAAWTSLAAFVLAGCSATTTYRPDYVHALPIPAAEQIDGKALIYMPTADAQYIRTAGAETFTGSGLDISMPLGLMTQQTAETVYRYAFRGGAEFASTLPQEPAAYRAVVQPQVVEFHHYFHQLENAGLTITPAIDMTLQVAVLGPEGQPVQTRRYSSGEVIGADYVLSGSPEEKISRLAHETLGKLLTQSVADVRAWLAAQPKTTP